MSARPVIFISAVSKELHSTRDLVAKTLLALGYDPKWQDIEATATGDLRSILRDWVDASDAVIQLVGRCYGFAPAESDPAFGACSYTQYEALYSRQQGKPVYYILTDAAHPIDICGCKPQTLHDLQEKYRQQVKSYGDLYHKTNSLAETELLIRRLKDDLAHLRAEGRQQQRWLNQKIVLVLGLVGLLILGGVWMMSLLLQQNNDLKAGMTDLGQMFEAGIKGGSEKEYTAGYNAAVLDVAQKRGLGFDAFRAFLDQNATRVLNDPTIPLKDKVSTLQKAGRFVQARDFAIEQARRLESERQSNRQEEAVLWTEAADIELNLGHYDKTQEYATKAVSLTDRDTDFPTWAAARQQQGLALRHQKRSKEARKLYEDLIPQQQKKLGPDHPDVLHSRRILALVMSDLHEYSLAEEQGRTLVADCKRVLGVEHPATLKSRSNLAAVLLHQTKNDESEQENREVVVLQTRVLGPESVNTLVSRMGVASALQAQKKYAEAEQEGRAVLEIQVRVLGVDHPDTLTSRTNLGNTLFFQKKYAEAEQEQRAALEIRKGLLGAEHPDVAISCYNLSLSLYEQKKLPEALQFLQRAEQTFTKVRGPDDPDTQGAKAWREIIEAAQKQEQTL